MLQGKESRGGSGSLPLQRLSARGTRCRAAFSARAPRGRMTTGASAWRTRRDEPLAGSSWVPAGLRPEDCGQRLPPSLPRAPAPRPELLGANAAGTHSGHDPLPVYSEVSPVAVRAACSREGEGRVAASQRQGEKDGTGRQSWVHAKCRWAHFATVGLLRVPCAGCILVGKTTQKRFLEGGWGVEGRGGLGLQ